MMPEKFDVDGVLLIDKPQGVTSNAVLKRVQKLFFAKKAGHAGTLDPLATGMLPICLGEATKFCRFLLDADKCYEATGVLGIKTTTSDALGEVVSSMSSFNITPHQLAAALRQFEGKITQTPSMYSALKHEGKPLYYYARQGIEVPRKSREVMIHVLELQSFDGVSFRVRVACSKGTYIRNLIEDIGDVLGVGAHVGALHRVYTAGFEQHAMVDLEALSDMCLEERMLSLRPADCMLSHLPVVTLTTPEVIALQQGQVIAEFSGALGLIRLYDANGKLIGVGAHEDEGVLKAVRLCTVKNSLVS